MLPASALGDRFLFGWWWVPLIAVCAIGATPGTSAAQRGQNPKVTKEYRNLPLEGNLGDSLKSQLQDAKDIAALQDLVQKIRDDPDLIQKIRNNPEKYGNVEDLAKTLGVEGLDPGRLKRIAELVKKEAGKRGIQADQLGALERLTHKQKKRLEGGNVEERGDDVRAPQPEESKDDLKSKASQMVESTLDKATHGRMGEALSKLFFQMQSEGRASSGGAQWPSIDWLHLNPASPNFDSMFSNVGKIGGAPALSVAAGGGMALQIIAEAAVIALIGWALLRHFWTKHSVTVAAAALIAKKLGPWPVDPARISSREELIRAFEYLALSRLGEAARTAHHHAIAGLLGTSDDRARAAQALAALYESARYDPSPQDLFEAAWAAARRDLCLLSGQAAPALAGGAG
jgi:hypothetical protein